MPTTMAKKLTSGSGKRPHHTIEKLGQRHANALLLDNLAEFLAYRRRALAGDDLKTLIERQT